MKRWMRALKIVAFCLIVFLIGIIANGILNTNARSRVSTDTKDADGAQVLFFGTSQGALDLNPIVMWDERGIASYNFCALGQYIGTTYYEMKDVLNRQNPKVVLLDFESLTRPDDFLTISNKLYSLPMIADLKIRYEMYRDIIGDEPVYLVPFFRYHNRWKEITRNDARTDYPVMGCESHFRVQTEMTELPQPVEAEPEIIGERELFYLEQIVALTREKGCTLAFIDLPGYPDESDDVKRENSRLMERKTEWVRQWALENGVPVCEAARPDVYEQVGLEPEDFSDLTHLNVKGQEKISAYVADWLADQFELDNLRELLSSDWYERRLEPYRKLQQDKRLMMAETPEELFSCLEGGDYTVAIGLQGDYRADGDKFFPVLEQYGISREAYEAGGGFVKGRDGTWLFVSAGSASFRWSKQLGHDDLVLRGSASTDRNGNPTVRTELIMDRSDQSKVADGMNVLVFSHSQNGMLRCVGFE